MQRAVFRLFPGWTAVALATAGVIATVFASLSPRAGDVHAIAPCVAHSPSAEETTFLGLLQSWRNTNIAGSYPLSQSGALNAAAAGTPSSWRTPRELRAITQTGRPGIPGQHGR
ncbi:MAG: hypothetical protein IPI85_16565 [Dehalococcoidia bacterium]|nr:hypothetical protein [Dehalococcoidia bacterium]